MQRTDGSVVDARAGGGAMDWYVTRNGENFGPFAFDILVKGVRDGELRPDDMVWSNGMSDWEAAQKIPGLWSPPKLPDPHSGRPNVTAEIEEVGQGAKETLGSYVPQNRSEHERGAGSASKKKVGVIRRHWRGELTLPQAYWGVGFLLTIGLIGAGHAFGLVVPSLALGPFPLGLALGSFLIFLCACTVWQLVGVWRSAGNHMRTTRRSVWGSLARVVVLLAAVRAAMDFYTVIGPMLLESGRLATLVENIPPHQLRLLRNGTEVELAGGMPYGTADAMRALLDAAPGVQIVHLNSIGGRVAEGYEIYQLIRDRRLIAYTASDCVSACTVAFLGGTKRLLSTRARLGFHSFSFGTLDQKQIPEINAELQRTLSTHGTPPWFIEKALSTSAKSMWYPSKSELVSAKIVTDIVDPDQFGLSGITFWRNQEAIEQGLLSIPLYALVRDNDPDAFKKVADRFTEGVKLGRSVLEITRDVQTVFMSEIIPKYMLIAPNEVNRKYWKTQLAEMEYLRKTDPALCVAFLFPNLRSDSFNLKVLVPDALLKEDVAALTDLVEKAINNPRVGEAVNLDDEAAGVFSRISAKFPRAQELLAEPLKYTKEPDILCSAFLAFYSEIMTLPAGQSAGIRRAVLDPNR